jgi:hypothetical protein
MLGISYCRAEPDRVCQVTLVGCGADALINWKILIQIIQSSGVSAYSVHFLKQN